MSLRQPYHYKPPSKTTGYECNTQNSRVVGAGHHSVYAKYAIADQQQQQPQFRQKEVMKTISVPPQYQTSNTALVPSDDVAFAPPPSEQRHDKEEYQPKTRRCDTAQEREAAAKQAEHQRQLEQRYEQLLDKVATAIAEYRTLHTLKQDEYDVLPWAFYRDLTRDPPQGMTDDALRALNARLYNLTGGNAQLKRWSPEYFGDSIVSNFSRFPCEYLMLTNRSLRTKFVFALNNRPLTMIT